MRLNNVQLAYSIMSIDCSGQGPGKGMHMTECSQN